MSLRIDHPNLVRIENVYESPKELHLVMELMAGGTVFNRLRQRNTYTEKMAAEAANQMLLAIAYLHNNCMVHRDLKLQNFLYESPTSDSLKLIDFGYAKFWDGKYLMHKKCGTPNYVAPEVLEECYTEQADMWSLGVIVYQLLTGMDLFMGETSEKIMDNVKAFQPQWSKKNFEPLSENAKAFVMGLIRKDPDSRMRARDALRHPWITSCLSSTHAAPIQDSVIQSLVRFSRASHFRRACLSMMAWSLGREDRQELHKQFLALDQKRSGTISLQQLWTVLEKNYEINSHEARQLFKSLDTDEDGSISYSEFLAAAMYDHVRMHNHILLKTFRRFDKDNTGSIAVDDLRKVLGDSFEGSDLEELIREADSDKDGLIQYKEFLAFMRPPQDGAVTDATEPEELVRAQSYTPTARAQTHTRLLARADETIGKIISKSPKHVEHGPLRRRSQVQ